MSLRLCGFLCNRNGVGNSLLQQCLTSMAKIAEPIFVYDDASDEAVQPIYRQFGCVVIYNTQESFQKELFHKQQLLSVALRAAPDWILWMDTDTIIGRLWEDQEQAHAVLSQAGEKGIVRLHLHNLNLWRSNGWYRVDQEFDNLWHGVFWRNTGELHYRPVGKLHQKQYPHSFRDPAKDEEAFATEIRFNEPGGKLIHFGFASDLEIARKYFTYREHGQTGYPLNRLVDESTLDVHEVPAEWYPEWWLKLNGAPDVAPPIRSFDPAAMAAIPSLDAWRESHAD